MQISWWNNNDMFDFIEKGHKLISYMLIFNYTDDMLNCHNLHAHLYICYITYKGGHNIKL